MKRSRLLKALAIISLIGGGISSISAVELSTICTATDCRIDTPYQSIENNSNFSTDEIFINAQIGTFTNNKTITTKQQISTFLINGAAFGRITNLINHGNISGGIRIIRPFQNANMTITNYGTMGGVRDEGGTTPNITINNRGIINKAEGGMHFSTDLTIQNYAMIIQKSASSFNNFNGKNLADNSHLILTGKNIKFADDNAKMILNFGGNIEFGVAYFLDKLIVDTQGENKLKVDFSRLELGDKDLYTLVKSGDNAFIVNLIGGGGGGSGGGSGSIVLHTPITELYKANIRTMNNFWTLSNSMIFPRKSYYSQNLGQTHSLLQHSPSLSTSGARGWVKYPSLQTDSALDLKSYESFAYRNESVNRRIQRQNKRNYNKRLPNQSTSQNLKENQRNSQNLNLDSANKTNQTNQHNLRDSANHDYYFILTPFINYNSFAQSGNYNLSGFDYGFLTAFSTQVAESNHLGAHFIFSYGNLGDSKDKDLSIKSLNLNVGINYKLDLIWDMYLKARGDFYYFSNALDSLTIKNIKPNNLGFGASVVFGKDFNFGKGGVLGVEGGIDYKGLKTNEVLLNSQSYKQSLLNLIYADLGINYNKYFGGFGLNVGTGFKANLAPKLAESALLINTQNLRFTLDNDKYLAYANAGISYVLNTKNFDMEFSLAYYGNFGDRVISNGGGVEWRTTW